MADAQARTRGGRDSFANASHRTRVPCTRLSRIRAFFAAVHRPEAIPSPARCTTASKPSSADTSDTPVCGSHVTLLSEGDDERDNFVTACPPFVRNGTRAEPTKPCAPEMMTFMCGNPTLTTQPLTTHHS